MNSRTKIVLVVCLTVSIFSGLAPFLYSNSQVEAHLGDAIAQSGTGVFLKGSLKCETNGRGSTSYLGMHLGDDGPGRGGAGQVDIRVDDWTIWNAGTLDLDGDYPTTATIKGSLVKADNFVRTCIGSSQGQKFTLIGDLSGDCSNFIRDTPAKFRFEVHAGNVLQLTGTFQGTVLCEKGGLGNSNGGCALALATNKNDNLIGTSGNDCIDGKGGNDKLAGLAGNDKLNGGDGKDLLSGGNGNDELTGGNGADKFDCGAGNDKITDFKPSEGDIKSTNCE